MTRRSTLIVMVTLAYGLAGCSSTPTRTPTVVSVSTVINPVKDKLQFIWDNMPVLEKNAESNTAGKFADVIAVEDDPLQDISALGRVAFVMKAGRVYNSSL